MRTYAKLVLTGSILGLAMFACADLGAAQTPAARPAAPTTILDADPGWIWDKMVGCSVAPSTPTSAHTGAPGSSGTYIFSGSGIDVFGLPVQSVTVGNTVHRSGSVHIVIDGVSKGDFIEFNPSQTSAPIFSLHGLQEKNHSISILASSGWAVISSLTVYHSEPIDHSAPITHAAIPAGTYRFVPRVALDRCIDVLEYSKTEGAHLDIYPYMDQANEYFKIAPLGSDKYDVRPTYLPGMAMSLLPGTADQAPYIGIWYDIGNSAQVWTITISPSGYYRLSPASAPNVALACTDPQTKGEDVAIETFDGSTGQDWKIIAGQSTH